MVETAPACGFGERIRRARIGANKTRYQLAAAVGVHYNAVMLWEQGKAVPHEANLIRIAKATRTKATWLFYGE
jgi:transcriptional regulator with XRE-family HTH domain